MRLRVNFLKVITLEIENYYGTANNTLQPILHTNFHVVLEHAVNT